MIDSVIAGLLQVLQWPAVGYLFLGLAIGLWLGAVPGLGALIGMVIILPFTFGMDTASAFALLIGAFAVTSTSDAISCVLLGVPGTASSQATVLDGYPLGKQGQALRALGASFTSSAVGGVLGGIALALSLPIAVPIILAFGSPEFFLLGLLGLTMVGTVSGAAVSKGLVATLIGLMISQIGFPAASAFPRFTFDLQYLVDGLPLVPVLLGLFAIPELVDLAVRNASIAEVPKDKGSRIIDGIKDAWRHRWLMFRSSMIGIYIGILPGLGGSIADWIAYGHAVQSTKQKDNPQFGNGDIRGVIASDSSNSAVKGGDLIPTIVLGIPGSAGMAILLGVLLIQGLHPGRDMLTTHLDVTFTIVWTLILANILAALLLMVWSRQVAKAAFIDGHLIVPAVILFVFMGAWLESPDIGNWLALFSISAIGFVMKRSGWPRPALILGFVLGPIMEDALILSYQRYSFSEVVTRPMTMLLIAVAVIAIVLSVRGAKRSSRVGHLSPSAEGAGKAPLMSLPFSLLLLVMFAWALAESFAWPFSARLFPMTIAAVGLLLVTIAVVLDGRDAVVELRNAGNRIGVALRAAFGTEYYKRAAIFFLWLVALIALTPIAGQMETLLAFIFLYLIVWGRYRWYWAAVYTAACWLLLYAMYDRVLRVFWMEPFFLN